MKIAIIGGTFNPLHLGHLFLAEEVLCTLPFDKIVFIPAHIPAHKAQPGDVSPEQRLEMVRLALALYKNFLVEDCEIKRGGISYTIDTIQYLKEKYSINEKPGLVIGDDLVHGFPSWKQADTLAQSTRLIIAHRVNRDKQSLSYPHAYLDNLMLPLSSSDIRDRIRYNRAYRFLIPDTVYKYISENGLYKNCAKDDLV
jgi:nicotinate-nucleotide adenylyltransferase